MKYRMEVIPAIDVMHGKCVRLMQGDYNRCTTYREDPVEVARELADHGLMRLHVVDLDGARSGRVMNLRVLERMNGIAGLRVDFSGGIRTDADARAVFEAGATWICVGSMALTDVARTLGWMEAYGAERVIIGADVREGNICIRGWREETSLTVAGLMERYDLRVTWLMCTDITRDGMLAGPSVEYYRDLATKYPSVGVIASGGVSSLEDVQALEGMGIAGVVVGKAIYEGRIPLKELTRYMND